MTQGTQRLKGRRIVITGAGSGIGLATAQLFATEGAQLALLDHDEAAVSPAGAALNGFAARCDVTQADAVERALDQAEGALGGLDGLINAAGTLSVGKFEESTATDWMRVLDVNLNGTMQLCRAVLPAFRRTGGGTIVNIASIAALKPPPASCAYAVSKAGVLMLSRCLAMELGPDIRVNCVCPGTIETGMTAGLRQDNAVAERLSNSAAAKRFGKPQEVAQAMLFLTSEDSAFVNGATLTVDGGVAFH